MDWKEKRRLLALRQVKMIKNILERNEEKAVTDFWGVYNCKVNLKQYMDKRVALNSKALDKLVEHTDIKLLEYKELEKICKILDNGIYEAYRGDIYMGSGTVEELADKLKIKPQTVMYYASVSGRKLSTYVERVL